MTSPDGATWTSRTNPGAGWHGIAWSAELGLFVVVGNISAMTSPDGITWTSRTAAESNTWTAVAWSPTLRLFVSVASDGTNRVMTSPDGITWTARAAAEANQWYAIAWSPELGILAAVAGDGTNRVMTSEPIVSSGPPPLTFAALPLVDAATINWAVDPFKAVQLTTVTLGGNRTMAAPSGILPGMTGRFIVKQDGTGSRTLALPAGSKVSGAGGGAVTLSATANKIDILRWTYDGTNYFWSLEADFT